MPTLTNDLTRSIPHPYDPEVRDGSVPRREWLVTNGLGGYASGTVVGVRAWIVHCARALTYGVGVSPVVR